MQKDKQRIAKIIAAAGICSRRDAEKLIAEGRVKLNGNLVETPATLVSDSDAISIDGKLLDKKEKPRLWIFNKPKGVVTTHKDPQGRITVFEILPKNLPRVISIGRLDLNTEGLLLLTNSGELARHLELPSTGLKRIYRARVYGNVTQQIISQLLKGVEYNGIRYGSIIVEIEKKLDSGNYWVRIELTEGKNREIRNVFEKFDLKVNRLIRIQYGPYHLRRLATGEISEVKISDKL